MRYRDTPAENCYNLSLVKDFLKKFLGQSTWKKEWQEDLSASLQEAQKGLNLSMVVAIAVESDFYAEVLFILSFIGITLGSALGFFFGEGVSKPTDFLLFPLFGFAIGSSLFQFRHFYLSKLAPRAVRERVAARAKALFFDHSQNLKGKVALLYYSEMEHEVLLLSSPEILAEIPEIELQEPLSKLIRDYSKKNPLVAIDPCLVSLGNLFRKHLGVNTTGGMTPEFQGPIYIGGPSDKRDFLLVPILKGSKDIN